MSVSRQASPKPLFPACTPHIIPSPMPKAYGGKFWDELMVGQEFWTGGRTVTEGDVLAFSGLTGDFNPLHVDEEFARTSPFRKRARGIVTFAVTLFNQREEPVQEGEHILLLARRPG